MKFRYFIICMLLMLPCFLEAQQITFSDPVKGDDRDMDFEILGRIKGNILVFKNVRWNYALNIYNDSMGLKDKIEFDFLPNKTFNVDCITYPDFIYLVYQYQQKGILYCMAVKMDADGKKLNEPVQLDTTKIGLAGESKIYSTIYSEDKKKILVFKIQSSDEKAHFGIRLFDDQLQLLHHSRLELDYDSRKNNFSDFFVDNDGNFIFANSLRNANRDNPSSFSLITKAPMQDSFSMKRISFENRFIDELKLKVDNVNKRYVITSLFYKARNGNVDGVYCGIWDARADTNYASVFTEFLDDLKVNAKTGGNSKSAFNDYYLKNMILKKDGSFIIIAEDNSTQQIGSDNFNRFENIYGNSYLNSNSYYMYNPSTYGYYRPFNSYGNRLGVRYYYDNILALSISKEGIPEWSNIIHKQQFSDDNDNYLSFNTFVTNGEIHFLFNDISKRDKLLSDNILTPDGISRRNPTLRTYEEGYDFMPRFAKQIGARKVVVPCNFRGQITFAKIEF